MIIWGVWNTESQETPPNNSDGLQASLRCQPDYNRPLPNFPGYKQLTAINKPNQLNLYILLE